MVPLAEDDEYLAARAEVAAAGATMLAAERRFREVWVPAAERAAWKEVERARAALAGATDKVVEIKNTRSLEVCTALRAEQHEHLRSLFDALEAAGRAAGHLAGIAARIISAGYDCRSDILGIPLPTAIFALGSTADFGSELSRFRRELQSRGIID
jgi:hypothetical protein